MADLTPEQQSALDALAALADPARRARMSMDERTDAEIRAKFGIDQFTEGARLSTSAVTRLTKAAAGAASELYNGKKGASAFNGALDGMTGAMQDATKAIATMFPAAKGVAIAFSLASQAVMAYAKATNVMADGLYKGYQGLAKSGAAASDGMSGVFNDAKKLGLSMSELDGFVNLINENSRDLALFSGSVFEGRKRFADISKTMDGPVRTGLMNLGMSVQEIADGTAGYLRIQTRLGRSQSMTNDELAAGAARYLKEQDALSKVTGQSRKEMEDATERALQGEQFAAKVRQLQMSDQGEAAEKLIEMNKMYGAMGPKTQAGFQAIVTGNLSNKDAQDAFRASQGEMMASTQRVIDGQQDMGSAVQGTMQRMGQTADALGTTLGQVGAYEKSFGSFAEQQKGRQLAEGNFVENLRNAAAEQAKMGADGSKHADAMTANQVKIVDTQIKINHALENFVRDGIEPTQRAMQKLADIALKGAGEAQDLGPKGAVGLAGTAAGAFGGAKAGMAIGALAGPIGAAIGVALGGIVGGFLGKSAADAGANAAGLPGRSDGSMGATGKLIEDFGKGTPMMLHGREGIVTEKQLHEFGNSAITAGLGASNRSSQAGVLGHPDEQIRRLIQKNRRAMDKQVTVEEKILNSRTDHYDFIVSQIDAIEFNTTQEKRISTDDLRNIKYFTTTRDRLLDNILKNIQSQVTVTADAVGPSNVSAGPTIGAATNSSSGTGGRAAATPGPSAATEVEGAQSGGSTVKASEVLNFTARSGSASAFDGLNSRLKDSVISAAEEYHAATGKKFQVNSAKRDPADQKRLYDESVALGTPGRGPTGMAVAKPGRSPHEHGLAVDIQNYRDPAAVMAMNRQGLKQKVPGDPVHFSFGNGGIANGPSSGYLAELHGPEAVVPLPDGKTIPVRLENTGDFGNNSSEVKNELRQMMTEFKSAMQSMVEQISNKAVITALDEMVRAQKTGNDLQKKMLQAQS